MTISELAELLLAFPADGEDSDHPDSIPMIAGIFQHKNTRKTLEKIVRLSKLPHHQTLCRYCEEMIEGKWNYCPHCGVQRCPTEEDDYAD